MNCHGNNPRFNIVTKGFSVFKMAVASFSCSTPIMKAAHFHFFRRPALGRAQDSFFENFPGRNFSFLPVKSTASVFFWSLLNES